MMFLTRVIPSKGHILSQLEISAHGGDSYAQHQLLWQLFPGEKGRSFLFRYEQGKGQSVYYLLSQIEPVQKIKGAKICTKPFQPILKPGDHLAYTLRANPTRMIKSETPGERGRRVDVLMHAKFESRQIPDADIDKLQLQAAQDWLMEPERQNRLGVEFITQPEVTEHQQHQVYKPHRLNNQSNPIRFTSVNYEGILAITDPNKFLTQLGGGIGRAKAMGCGLMMIRPCR